MGHTCKAEVVLSSVLLVCRSMLCDVTGGRMAGGAGGLEAWLVSPRYVMAGPSKLSNLPLVLRNIYANCFSSL